MYYGTTPGVYLQARGAGVNVGANTSHTTSGLVSGRTYYFAVTAYDAAGNESGFSGEVSKVVQ